MDLDLNNRYCKESGITSTMLLQKTLPVLPCVKNGLVVELNNIRKQKFGTWNDFVEWLQLLFGNSIPAMKSALSKSVSQLESTRSKYQKNGSRNDKLDVLLEAPYKLPEQHPQTQTTKTPSKSPPNQSKFMREAVTAVNSTLALENAELRAQVSVGTDLLLAKNREISKLKEKIREFNPHNIRRQLKRKNSKLAKYSVTISNLKRESKASNKDKIKKLQDQVRYYARKCNTLSQNIKELDTAEDTTIDTTLEELKRDKADLLEINAELKDRIDKLSSRKLTFFEDGRYTDNLRVCIMELLSYNVGVLNVEPIIKSVLHLADIEYDRLPKHTAVSEILIEGRSLAQMQLTESLVGAPHTTLHSDGTTKFGHKYISYQVSTEEGSLSLGLQEVCSGAAESTLQALQDTVQQLAETSKATDTAAKIVANIKCTMSDRASTQKSFNTLLQDYRATILPTIVTNWDKLHESEKLSMTQMHNFYCGMHLVVNMAEHTSEALRLIERNYDSQPTHAFISESESGTIRLIRTACKAFQRRGDEKSGCPLQFTSYLKRKGLAKNPLIHFRGNRFNIIFANGARVYYLRDHISNFLQNVWGTPNRLLKAVLDDILNQNYLAGCKALGIIDKLITGPLWRLLELEETHIMDVPDHYKKLQDFLTECTSENIQDVMRGEKLILADLVRRDEVWESLFTPSIHDNTTEHLLLSLFKTFEHLLQKVLADHQPVMASAEKEREQVELETRTANPTNTISERDFAKLDRLLREKPNASILALEAHILFSNNRTSPWFHAKSPEEKKKMLEEARKNAPQHRKKYREHLVKLQDERNKKQSQKVKEREETERRLVESKEKITSELTEYGLWVSVAEVNHHVSTMKSETKKRKALKAQLRFRQKVLQQQHPDKLVFAFSSKEKGQFTSSILCQNLLQLVRSCVSSEPIPSSPCFSLAGKHVQHNFKETDGAIIAYEGKVISEVPGFEDWYNIVYTLEPDIVYTYKLTEDLKNGDLKIIQS